MDSWKLRIRDLKFGKRIEKCNDKVESLPESRKDKDMNKRREKTGKLEAWSWRPNIQLIQAPEKEIWKDLKRRHKISSNWKSWLPQWKGSPKCQWTETIPSHSMSIASVKKPPWDRSSEEDQGVVICTRDLLGEMPVKDERTESKDRGAEPSDHNAGLIPVKGEGKDRLEQEKLQTPEQFCQGLSQAKEEPLNPRRSMKGATLQVSQASL